MASSREKLRHAAETEQKLRQELKEKDQELGKLRALQSANAVSTSTAEPAYNRTTDRQNIQSSLGKRPWCQDSDPGPTITHMGRLVPNGAGIEYFAGSTTGVHFVLSVQSQYQKAFKTDETFPKAFLCVHSFDSYPTVASNHAREGADTSISKSTLELEISLTVMNAHFYRSEVDKYFNNLACFYPILAKKQFYESFESFLDSLSAGESNPEEDAFEFQLYSILALNSFYDYTKSAISDLPSSAMLNLATKFQRTLQFRLPQIISNGSLSCLQGLLLYLLFAQATSQHALAIQLNGMTVRLAQLLGLHRHPRRFKFTTGETEIRKRIWSCVYILDVYVQVYL